MSATKPAPELSVLREPLREVGGEQVLSGLTAALSWLEANQQEINDLNVFPVPDGDTGSNMYLTLRSAVEEAGDAPEPSAVASVLAAAAHGSLMGARGNSGVILSQILRGFAQGVAQRSRVDARGVAVALNEASAVAYRAVMKPTEGTILTVVRDAAAAGNAAAAETDDIRVVLDRVVSEAHAAVERTINQLQVLRDANVVDAGGFGLAVILEGFARAIASTATLIAAPSLTHKTGEPPLRLPPKPGEIQATGSAAPRRGAAAVAHREQGWGYCTEFLINGPGLDVEAIQAELGALGESALVVGDPDLVRVHIHTGDPATLIAAASSRGRMSKLKVEDMSIQHHEVLARADAAEIAAAPEGSPPATPALPEAPAKPIGVVSVASGDGFREILTSLGADSVVSGGQTMNPSIEDLLNGVRAANAERVILLPNNGNVILTAEQVNPLADDCEVRVVPTRNLPQGISAMLAFDPGASIDENAAQMAAAIATVRAVEITHAVRDTSVNGLDIKAGDVIAVVDDEITKVGDDYLSVIEAVLAAEPAIPELVTVYRGDAVSEADAESMVGSLRAAHSTTEFEIHTGGQEHYPYVLSLE
ncbi:MAG: DAK2 domain-containing protein [Candidatus Dormiibacterota bacterium]